MKQITTDAVRTFLSSADLSTVCDDDAAEAVELSVAQLRYRLGVEGTKYSDLLKAERMARCKVLLAANPHIDGHGLARKCGYAGQSQLYRAFNEWFGFGIYQVKHRGARI